MRLLEQLLDDPQWIAALELFLADSEETPSTLLECSSTAEVSTAYGPRRIDIIVRVGKEDPLKQERDLDRPAKVLEEQSYTQAEVLGYGVDWGAMAGPHDNFAAKKALLL